MKSQSQRIIQLCAMVALLFAFFAPVRAADAPDNGWTTSYAKAVAAAKAGKKLILADFSGSDWCGPCMRLKKEVLDSDDFKALAKDKFSLLEVDFPHHTPQSGDVAKQNQELMQKYGVKGFPSVILMDAEGKELGRIVGYGNKERWMEKFKAIMEKAAS
jgi:thioredoxin-related protein